MPWNKGISKIKDRPCLKCGKLYRPRRKSTKYCSRDCSISATFKGKPFTEEHKVNLSRSLKGKVHKNKEEKQHKICKYCKKDYIPCYKKQKYCSSKCFATVEIKGKPVKESVKQKISMTRRKLSKFDGYAISTNKLLRNSHKWKLWREKVFIRDDYTCKKCELRGCYLEPHHIIQVKECIEKGDLDMIFDIDNGMTLCRPCHKKIHGWKTKLGGD